MNKKIRNIAAVAFLTLVGTAATAQVAQQKVGGNPMTINQNAALEVESVNKGLLLPRLELTATDNFAPLTAHVEGMTVYNTATAGTGATAVTPGYYYNDGAKWVRIADAAIIKTEPWFNQDTNTEATENTDNIYQMGNVAVGTRQGVGTFHIDAAKNNPTGANPNATQVLDDIIVTPGGRIGIGYNPSDVVILGNQLDDKVTFQANDDLDVNYSLATGSSNAQAIVHRNIISNGTIGARTARPNGTSIAAFEGHTSTSSGSYGGGSLITQQRAGIVLRTGKENNVGGEIWFGTSGATDGGSNLSTTAGNWYRAVMDQRGRWAFGADPNGETYATPTERLDVLYGGLRIRSFANTGSFNTAERPNYISTDATDRLVVVDANGVLKNKDVSAILPEAVTADNGLTKTTNNIRLGGALTAPTTITADATNTLAVAGLQTGAATDKIVVADADGVLKTVAASTISASEPWKVQDTGAEADDNQQDIYQEGKVAIGFTDADGVSEKQLEVKGDFRTVAEVAGREVGFDTNMEGSGIGMWYNANDFENPTDMGVIQLHQNSVHLVAQSPTNIGASQIAPGLVEYRAGNWGLTDGVSIHHMDKDQIFLSSASGSAGGNDDLTSLYVRKGEGILFAHTDDNGDREGEYTFPRNAGEVGQVLAVETNVSDVSTLEWKDVSDLVKAAMPKFFYMPSIVLPTNPANLSDGVTYDAGTETFTVNLHGIYSSQFGMTGDVAGAARTAIKSTTATTLPVLTAPELEYFVTYFDNTVFDPTTITLDDAGIMTYKIVPSAAVTEKTYMNIVFKVK